MYVKGRKARRRARGDDGDLHGVFAAQANRQDSHVHPPPLPASAPVLPTSYVSDAPGTPSVAAPPTPVPNTAMVAAPATPVPPVPATPSVAAQRPHLHVSECPGTCSTKCCPCAICCSSCTSSSTCHTSPTSSSTCHTCSMCGSTWHTCSISTCHTYVTCSGNCWHLGQVKGKATTTTTKQ